MNVEKGKNWLIKNCKEAIEDNIASSLAISLSAILATEEEELIKRSWRSELNYDYCVSFIKNDQYKVEEEWQREYRQLKRITDYGGYMEYEEMMLILCLRSDLENGLRFVAEKPKKTLADLDEDLKDVLKLNREYTRDSRNAARSNTGDPSTYLKNHWWWRYDEEN